MGLVIDLDVDEDKVVDVVQMLPNEVRGDVWIDVANYEVSCSTVCFGPRCLGG